MNSGAQQSLSFYELPKMNDMNSHITQTCDRLQCIKQHLNSPSGFQSAARELLEWCSDTRAFQRAFEDGLIGCLTVVSQVAARPGYDLDLGYRLLAVCAAHRDKFTQKSASMLSFWCEDLGRLLLLRHQKNRPTDSPKNQNMLHQPNKMQPGPPPNEGALSWQQAGAPQPQQSLSVVTTVWAGTQPTQSAPFTPQTPHGYTNTTMSSPAYTQQPQGYHTNAGPSQMQKPPYNPQAMGGYRPTTPGYNRGSYPPTPNTPGANPAANQSSEFQPPPGALSAAALVAAAATATATATATASMAVLQEQQNQQQQLNMNMNNMNNQFGSPQVPGQHPGQQYNNQYHGPPGPGRPPGPMSLPPQGGPGMPTKPTMPGMYSQQRRPSPYPNHQQYMQQKRGFGAGQQPYGPQQYGPGQQQYGPGGPKPNAYPPQQQPLPSPNYGPQQQMRPTGPPPPPNYTGQPPYGMNHGQFPRQQGMNNFNNQPNYPNNLNYQHSPIPGNPTPPMTPGSQMPPYPPPGTDIKPNLPDIKPNIKRENDELRLTFPVRDGVVLPPFRLEHNLAVSNHVFHLRESVYQTLMWRSDLELQLKCFHHEDRQMNTNWPASVTVSVNANPLNIERGENKTSHKPLYLKEVCQPGRNTIQITVTACCCSHLFVLQLVHRPSVRSVLQGLLRKRLLPAEHCITKIKRNFSSVAANSAQLNGSAEDGVEQTAIKVSLKCPITFRRITLPARGHDCKHIPCFDLESYLQLNCERGAWRCPVCNKTALLEGLEIDQYIWGILTNLGNTEFEEVTIDSTASWKPVAVKPVKGEESEPCNGGTARWMKAMSPSSMQMPNMNTIPEYTSQPSPYSIPPVTATGAPLPPYTGSYGNPGSVGSQLGSDLNQGNFQTADFASPLSHLNENIAANDMVSVEKQLNRAAHTPSSQFGSPPPHTPHSVGPHSVGTLQHQNSLTSPPPSVASATDTMCNGVNNLQGQNSSTMNSNTNNSNNQTGNTENNTHGSHTDLPSDLNFDPTAIIDGDSAGQESLDLLPDNIGELLSYLGPQDQPNSGAGNSSNTDDLLSLFD